LWLSPSLPGAAAGACKGSAKDCDDNNPCTADACGSQGGCVHTPTTSGCDDKDPCTLGDACKDKACVAGAPLPCQDNNPCTQDACDDGKASTVGDQCDGKGGCAGTADVVKVCGLAATLEGTCATVGVDPVSGACVVTPKNQLASCIADACSSSGFCSGGLCAVGDNTCFHDIDPAPAPDPQTNWTTEASITAVGLAGARAAVAWPGGQTGRMVLVRPDGAREGLPAVLGDKVALVSGTALASLADGPNSPAQALLGYTYASTAGAGDIAARLWTVAGDGALEAIGGGPVKVGTIAPAATNEAIVRMAGFGGSSAPFKGAAVMWIAAGAKPFPAAKYSAAWTGAGLAANVTPVPGNGWPNTLATMPDGSLFAHDSSSNLVWCQPTQPGGPCTSKSAVFVGQGPAAMPRRLTAMGSYLLIHNGSTPGSQLFAYGGQGKLASVGGAASLGAGVVEYSVRAGAVFDDGGWVDSGYSQNALYLRFYDPKGNPYAPPRQLDQVAIPTIARIDGERVMVAWFKPGADRRYAIAFDRYGRALTRRPDLASASAIAVAVEPASGIVHRALLVNGEVQVATMASPESNAATAKWSATASTDYGATPPYLPSVTVDAEFAAAGLGNGPDCDRPRCG